MGTRNLVGRPSSSFSSSSMVLTVVHQRRGCSTTNNNNDNAKPVNDDAANKPPPATGDGTSATATTQSSSTTATEAAAVVSTDTTGEIQDASKRSFLAPSDDVVLEHARKALTRDGRDKQANAEIWHEDSAYPPILARGKKSVYDYTDDIPIHVKPYYGHEWYQQREYFQGIRNRKPWPRVLAEWSVTIVVLSGLCVVVALLRIWIQQPRDLQEMRGEMLQSSYGRVLELAAGHGQNIGLYPFAVHEIVMCDSNAAQLQTLRYRIPNTAYPKYDVRRLKNEQLADFDTAEFDCVVDMFGLCHYRDPVAVLRQMQRVVKPTGVILLLEHGATSYPPVNWFLDKFEKRHTVNTHGCKWNQPVVEYLKESRMEVKELRNKHFGTTYYVVGYPENLEALQETVAVQAAA